MKILDDNSDSIVTDPPYEFGSGEEVGQHRLLTTWNYERVFAGTKPGGLLAFWWYKNLSPHGLCY